MCVVWLGDIVVCVVLTDSSVRLVCCIAAGNVSVDNQQTISYTLSHTSLSLSHTHTHTHTLSLSLSLTVVTLVTRLLLACTISCLLETIVFLPVRFSLATYVLLDSVI